MDGGDVGERMRWWTGVGVGVEPLGSWSSRSRREEGGVE